MFNFFKKRKFEKWCEIENIKNKNPHYYKYFKSIIDKESLNDIKRVWHWLKSKKYTRYLEKSPLQYVKINDLTNDLSLLEKVHL